MERKKKRSDEVDEDKNEFQEYFPALSKEISEGGEEIEEKEMRTSLGSKSIRRYKGYIPGVIDYICRCKTEEEALEIINYMLDNGDISEEYAENLKAQLKEKGLKFFGEHRAPGFYERA
ncbi:MAG: DUF2095 family protein [Candidatus Heimdallarchaeota archaeon]|nr:DUF2095 family protein [Candidatus Heimdallarchaeota archaeon]MCK4954747.1 DUF2095 family protein [Candidatus Heimdallarchaeota archaeon]